MEGKQRLTIITSHNFTTDFFFNFPRWLTKWQKNIYFQIFLQKFLQIKLSNLENMDLTTKKGHLTIKLLVHGDNCKYLLRSGHDTRHWFNMIMVSDKHFPSICIWVSLQFSVFCRLVVTNLQPQTWRTNTGRTSLNLHPDPSPYKDGYLEGQVLVN